MNETATIETSIISWHKCDICKHENYTIYILQLDKWYCTECIQKICKILETL